jgi:hypothetical protein
MKNIIVTVLTLLIASPALAQNNTCPTAPFGTNNNQCASTQFVQQATSGISLVLPQGQIFVGNPSNIAAPVTMSGEGSINSSGVLTVAAPAGTLTGGTLAPNVLASSITSTGTLTGGATGTGFTVALGASTVTGALGVANGGIGATTLGAGLPLFGNGTSPLSSGALTGTGTKLATATFNSSNNGSCIQVDASGNAVATGASCAAGGTGAPGAPSTSIQFNNAGAFAGSANLEWNDSTKVMTLTGGTWDGGNFIQAPVGFNNLMGWSNLAFSNASGTTMNLGNGTPPDRSGQLNLGTIDANVAINLPDGGQFNPVGTINDSFNGVFFRSSNAGQAAPSTFFGGSGAIWVGNNNGIGGLNFQGQSATAATACYGGAGGSSDCAQWGMNFLNELGWQLWGQQQSATDNQNLIVGQLRATYNSILDSSSFTHGMASFYNTDLVVSGSVATLGSITAGSGYTPGTYKVILSASGAGQYTQQVWATVVVGGGGGVSSVTILPPDQFGNSQVTGYGIGFHKGDVLTTASLPAGSGFSVPVATIIAANGGTGGSDGLAAPQYRGQLPGYATIWGLGPNSSDPFDTATVRLGTSDDGGAAWYNSTPLSLAIGGSLLLGTETGTAHYPSAPDGNLQCDVGLASNSGTAAFTVCRPVATFSAIGSGSAAGSGYTNGSYTGVVMTIDWGRGSTCTGVTADIVVSGGAVTSYTLNHPGTGCAVGDRLLPETATIGAGTGGYATVASLSTTPAPVSASYILLAPVAISALPTCNSGFKGARAVVNNASAPTYLATFSGTGSVVSGALCNGAAWVSG